MPDRKHQPFMPWDCSKPIVVAFKAIAEGTASPEQQRMVMHWLINQGCRTYDMDWFPGGEEGERMSSFAAGRRFVGQQLVRQINLKVGKMKEQNNG